MRFLLLYFPLVLNDSLLFYCKFPYQSQMLGFHFISFVDHALYNICDLEYHDG